MSARGGSLHSVLALELPRVQLYRTPLDHFSHLLLAFRFTVKACACEECKQASAACSVCITHGVRWTAWFLLSLVLYLIILSLIILSLIGFIVLMAHAACLMRWCGRSMHDSGSGCMPRAHAPCRSHGCSSRRCGCGCRCRNMQCSRRRVAVLHVACRVRWCSGLGRVGCGCGCATHARGRPRGRCSRGCKRRCMWWKWQCRRRRCAFGLCVVHVGVLVELNRDSLLGSGRGPVGRRPEHTEQVLKVWPGSRAPARRAALVRLRVGYLGVTRWMDV